MPRPVPVPAVRSRLRSAERPARQRPEGALVRRSQPALRRARQQRPARLDALPWPGARRWQFDGSLWICCSSSRWFCLRWWLARPSWRPGRWRWTVRLQSPERFPDPVSPALQLPAVLALPERAKRWTKGRGPRQSQRSRGEFLRFYGSYEGQRTADHYGYELSAGGRLIANPRFNRAACQNRELVGKDVSGEVNCPGESAVLFGRWTILNRSSRPFNILLYIVL